MGTSSDRRNPGTPQVEIKTSRERLIVLRTPGPHLYLPGSRIPFSVPSGSLGHCPGGPGGGGPTKVWCRGELREGRDRGACRLLRAGGEDCVRSGEVERGQRLSSSIRDTWVTEVEDFVGGPLTRHLGCHVSSVGTRPQVGGQ